MFAQRDPSEMGGLFATGQLRSTFAKLTRLRGCFRVPRGGPVSSGAARDRRLATPRAKDRPRLVGWSSLHSASTDLWRFLSPVGHRRAGFQHRSAAGALSTSPFEVPSSRSTRGPRPSPERTREGERKRRPKRLPSCRDRPSLLGGRCARVHARIERAPWQCAPLSPRGRHPVRQHDERSAPWLASSEPGDLGPPLRAARDR